MKLEATNAPQNLVNIKEEYSLYPFGAKGNERDSSVRAAHHKTNLGRFQKNQT